MLRPRCAAVLPHAARAPQTYSVIVRTPLDFGISLTMWDGVWRETLTTIPQRFETCAGP